MNRLTRHFISTPIQVRVLFALVVVGGASVPLVSGSLDDVDSSTKILAQIAFWSLWSILLLCVMVPSSISLTALRLVAPAHSSVALIIVAAEPSASSIIVLALSAAMTSFAFMAEIGAYFVQKSAYGDEMRFLLRSPTPMAAVQLIMWMLWVSSAIVGALALVNRAWIAGGILVTLAVVGVVLLPPRFHRLSRRWLVRVPAGIVVHDHVVLAETAMFSRSAVTAIELTDDLGDDADLAGGGRGPGLRVTLSDFDTVVLAATSEHPGGRAIHVRSFRVRPSRPGRALRALLG
ncbi:MAG: hypothetical protein RL391_171 [Actinomycetota bacterium]|jgi:hypothetical protein